jgi:hypothetical protein
MPMPTTVNGLPVRTGSWEPAEDRALAEWQAQLGNRWAGVCGCRCSGVKPALLARCTSMLADCWHAWTQPLLGVQVGGRSEAHPRSHGAAVRPAVAPPGKQFPYCPNVKICPGRLTS